MADKKVQPGAEGKKKPPLMVIIVAAVLLGLVISFAFVKQVSAKESTQPKKVEPGPVIPLDEFLINLADPGGDHFLKLTIALELSKAKGKTPEELKDQIPAMRDAINSALNEKTRDDLVTNAKREKIKQQLKIAVNKKLGDELVTQVYFTNLVTQ